ncbi:MAG: choice-of-anchor I family protein [Lacipirellulaceae bacterium]
MASVRVCCVTAFWCLTLLGSQQSHADALEARLAWRMRPQVETVEIAAIDQSSQRLFVTTEQGIVNLRLSDGQLANERLPVPAGYHATSVAASGGRIALALAAEDKRQAGRIDLFESATGEYLTTFPAGSHPDMVCFTPNGRYLLCANEGEPTDAYDYDGEGSVTVVDLAGSHDLAAAKVSLCEFTEFNSQAEQLRQRGVRLFGPSQSRPDGHATVAEDLEPEYITCSPDSRRAWVTLQENNAIAEIDLATARVTAIHPLGEKDFRHVPVGLAGNPAYATTGLDASDADEHLQVQLWPVKASYEPDAIASFQHEGQNYLVTANEGDPREYAAYHEAAPACELIKLKQKWDDRAAARHLMQPEYLGRLQVCIDQCDPDGDGDIDELHAFGTRSFSVWRASEGKLELVFDSGSDFERVLAMRAIHDALPTELVDNRSHVRGPEPEGVVLGEIAGRRYAFIGLERASGVMVYDLTEPLSPTFCCYIPPAEEKGLKDISPEGLVFVPADESPTRGAMLVVANEFSATVTAYDLRLSK